MAKIEILRQTVANSNPVSIGDVIEVTESVARQLIGTGKAKYYEAPAVQAVAQEEPKPEPVAKAAPKSKAKAKTKSKAQKKDK